MGKSRVQGGQRAADGLRKKGITLRAALKRAVTESAIELLTHVKAKKLSGQVLNVQTGRLRRSINYKITSTSEDRVQGTVGTNVEYARRFELGFDGTEDVREHLRLVTQAFGKELPTPVWSTVKAHKRKANQPEKSFLGSALKECREAFTKRINEAIQKAKES